MKTLRKRLYPFYIISNWSSLKFNIYAYDENQARKLLRKAIVKFTNGPTYKPLKLSWFKFKRYTKYFANGYDIYKQNGLKIYGAKNENL